MLCSSKNTGLRKDVRHLALVMPSLVGLFAENVEHVAGCGRSHVDVSITCDAAYMGAEHHVRNAGEDVRADQRLFSEAIEPGRSQFPRSNCVDDRMFVQEPTACRVDEDCSVPHQSKRLAVDHVLVSKSLKPDSATVGTSGRSARRLVEVTTSGRILPPLI